MLHHMLRAAAGNRGSYQEYMLSLNPLAYWKLDEASGTSAADETGSHPATHQNSPNVGVAPLISEGGLAVGYPGSATVKTRVSTNVLPASGTTGAHWFSFRVKTTNTTDQMFLWDRGASGSTSNRIFIALNRDTGFALNQICLFTNDGFGANLYLASPATGMTDGNAHSVLIQYDGANSKIFYDGQERALAGSARAGRVHNGNGHWIAGFFVNSTFFYDGVLDEVAVGSGTVTPTQAAELHALA